MAEIFFFVLFETFNKNIYCSKLNFHHFNTLFFLLFKIENCIPINIFTQVITR